MDMCHSCPRERERATKRGVGVGGGGLYTDKVTNITYASVSCKNLRQWSGQSGLPFLDRDSRTYLQHNRHEGPGFVLVDVIARGAPDGAVAGQVSMMTVMYGVQEERLAPDAHTSVRHSRVTFRQDYC